MGKPLFGIKIADWIWQKKRKTEMKGDTRGLVFPFFNSNVYPADKLHTIETEILCLGKESPDGKIP